MIHEIGDNDWSLTPEDIMADGQLSDAVYRDIEESETAEPDDITVIEAQMWARKAGYEVLSAFAAYSPADASTLRADLDSYPVHEEEMPVTLLDIASDYSLELAGRDDNDPESRLRSPAISRIAAIASGTGGVALSLVSLWNLSKTDPQREAAQRIAEQLLSGVPEPERSQLMHVHASLKNNPPDEAA